jgi:hypothetical protein
MSEEEINEELWQAGGAGGGIVRDCPHGITYFSDEEAFFEEGEFEDLKAKSKATPEKYIMLNRDAHSSFLFGKEYVYECPKCTKELQKIQRYLWAYRREIAAFLNDTLTKRAEEAATEKENLTIPNQRTSE